MSPTRGAYEQRVESWGSLSRRASARLGGLEGLEGRIRINDHDRFFSKMLATYGAKRLRRSAVLIRLTSDEYDDAVAPEISLRLQGWQQVETGVQWDLMIRPDDRWLISEFLKLPILKSDWPNANPDSYAESEPIIYGVHDSRGTSSRGAVPLLCVDTIYLKYLVSRGYLLSVDRVYLDEKELAPGTDYTTSVVTINGRTRTLVTLVEDPDNEEAKGILTADVHGLETVGNGEGTLIENPVDCLRHALINFGWNDYQSGLWNALGTTPLDEATFEAMRAFCELKEHKMSRRFSGKAIEEERNYSVHDLISEVCLSFGIRCWWMWSGKIGIGPFANHFVPSSPRTWVKWDLQQLGSAPIRETDSIETRIIGQFQFNEAEEKYLQSLEVNNSDYVGVDSVTTKLEFRSSYDSVL